MACQCRELTELTGSAATTYAREHLDKLEIDQANWTIRYRCPATGAHWLQDYPHGESHGGGPPRLHRIDPA